MYRPMPPNNPLEKWQANLGATGWRAASGTRIRCRSTHAPSRATHARRGLTLVELLIAMSLMVVVAAAMGTLANGVQQSYDYCQGRSEATQHARVVLDRIASNVRDATANDQFPGVLVVAEDDGGWRFPDTLVIWHPSGTPADPDGLPRYNELLIYSPHPTVPNRLVEIVPPSSDTRVVPATSDTTQWHTQIASIKSSSGSKITTLTNLVRSCPVTDNSSNDIRGAVRFEVRLRPSADEWEDYQNNSLSWDELAWVQGICGSNTGLRQVWLRTELQLLPGDNAVASDLDNQAIAFFGSAALYYEMHR